MSGDSEQPKTSDWQQRVLDSYDEAHDGRTGRRSVGLVFTPDELKVLRTAARVRDMSLAAYTRRCALAMAARDLGIDYLALMANEATVQRFGLHERGRSYGGRGFGPWIITEIREP